MSCIWESVFENKDKNKDKEYKQQYIQEEYFSRDTAYINIYFDGKKSHKPSKSLYYFSNTYDTKFDISKVGRLTDGKYIIREGSIYQTVGDSILKVSDGRIDLVRNYYPGDDSNRSHALIFRSEKLPHLL